MTPLLLRFRAALLCGTALAMPMPLAAQTIAPNSGPVLDRVIAGGITIVQDPARTQVTQTGQRGIVDWRGFNVGAQHEVRFQQPSSTAATLNRVTTRDPSVIAGRITANGRIAIVNQSGVVFTEGAQVEAAGLIVSSADITNENFLAGRMVFDRAGAPDARIENAGTITIREAGLAALVAPQVANRGTITARLGRVALAGAETHVIDLHGDGLLSIEVTGAVRQAPAGGGALVTNSGTISAEGGAVQITAAAADGIVQELVRAGGRIAAETDAATGRTGRVTISGTGGAIRIEGEVSATGAAPGSRGGAIEAVADRVLVDTAGRVDASGAAGGGEVAIGTTLRGSVNPRLARRTGIAAGATIRADATGQGRGGTVIVNSQDYTAHAGSISVRGGPQGGDGGFAEVSGQGGLLVLGAMDASAPAGAPGTALIDPIDLTIIGRSDPEPPGASVATIVDNVLGADDPPDTAFIRTDAIEFLSGDIRLEAQRDIFVNAPITGDTVGGALTLDAGRTIEVNDRITRFQGLTLIARTGDVLVQNQGFLSDTTGITVSAGNAIAIGGSGMQTAGTLDLQAGLAGIGQTAPVLAALLQLRTPGSAVLDFVSPDPDISPNRVGALGASDVGGDLVLRTSAVLSAGAPPPLVVQDLVTVGGRLTLLPETGVTQAPPSRIEAAELVVDTPGTISLAGNNGIAAVERLDAADFISLRNASNLLVSGPVTANGGGSTALVGIEVAGGDITIAAPVLATSSGSFTSIALNASGNIAVTAAGSITADGPSINAITMQAASDFGAGGPTGTNRALPGGMTLAGTISAEGGSVLLGAGTGGIVQTGGGIVTGLQDAPFPFGLGVLSGGDALLGSAGNAVAVLDFLQVAGNFLLANGTNDLLVVAGQPIEGPVEPGSAATIALRTAGAVTLASLSALEAPGDAGRISVRAGSLVAEPGATATANLIEVAPSAPTSMVLPVAEPPPGTFGLTANDLAGLRAQTLRLGATTFDGALTTTADGISIVAPLALAGTLDLRSLASIAQDPGAALVVGALTGAAGGSVTLTDPANVVPVLAGFTAGADFALVTQTPLLTVPGGTLVQAGGALGIEVLGGSMRVDGTVIGATTALTAATGSVTVNGFSAIATAGDLTLAAQFVTLAGLAQAAGNIQVFAEAGTSLAGTALTANTLLVSAPSVSFGGLNADAADVRLALGDSGTASGTLFARGLTVEGGSGAVLLGTIDGIAGRPAAARGRRATVGGTLLGDPPPALTDFTFNGCPIGVALCAVPPERPPFADNPEEVTGELDPLSLLAALDRLRPPAPEISLQPARDQSEENELAPPDIRAGDY